MRCPWIRTCFRLLHEITCPTSRYLSMAERLVLTCTASCECVQMGQPVQGGVVITG